jgi:hypothetical protein
MNIIAITTCVNYHDILKHMLPNSKFFSKWYIVTSPEDKNTISLIENSGIANIEILLYNDFYKNSKFNFGGSRKFAQEYIDKHYTSSNILFLDADICLPVDFMNKLPKTIEDDTLYGVSDRFDYWTLDNYIRKKNPHKYCRGRDFVGFFQLYKQSPKYKYKDSQNCSICDNDFRGLFKEKINLQLSVRHLGKERINWNGRSKTGPTY